MGYNVFGSYCQLTREIEKIKGKKTRGQENAVATDKISISEMGRKEDSAPYHFIRR